MVRMRGPKRNQYSSRFHNVRAGRQVACEPLSKMNLLFEREKKKGREENLVEVDFPTRPTRLNQPLGQSRVPHQKQYDYGEDIEKTEGMIMSTLLKLQKICIVFYMNHFRPFRYLVCINPSHHLSRKS